MKNILVACDFTAFSVDALKFAHELASQSDATIHLLHVVEYPFYYETTFGVQPYWQNHNLLNELTQQANTRFEKLEKTFGGDGVKMKFYVERGNVDTIITEKIDELDIDLIVMGAHGHNPNDVLAGRHLLRVIRSSPVPVIAFRNTRALKDIKRIAFSSLLDGNEAAAIQRVKQLQRFLNAELHIVRVNTPAHFMTDRQAEAAFAQYARQFDLRDATFHICSDNYEQDGIVNFCRDEKIDLLAMATHGRKGLAYLFRGSITEDVIEITDIPVWTYTMHKEITSDVVMEGTMQLA